MAQSVDWVWAGQGRVAPAGAVPRSATMDLDADPTAIDVQGNERLAWDQRASSRDELGGVGFNAYVNGRVQTLSSVSCASSSSAAGFECTATLPALDPGVNVIEVAAYLTTDAAVEGQRSPPIHLRFGRSPAGEAGGAGLGRMPVMDRTWATADGVRLRATEVATGLDNPTDLLPLPDGRVLIAERSGRVRVFRDGALLPAAGLVLEDVTVGDGRGLLALAADHAFSSTQRVFAIYSTEDGLRVARFTVAGDRLVDRAILLDGLPAASVQPAALLRTGPDGRLYLALDDGGDSRRLGDLGCVQRQGAALHGRRHHSTRPARRVARLVGWRQPPDRAGVERRRRDAAFDRRRIARSHLVRVSGRRRGWRRTHALFADARCRGDPCSDRRRASPARIPGQLDRRIGSRARHSQDSAGR